MKFRIASCAAIALALSGPVTLSAQETATEEAAPEVTAETVVARIGETEITMGHVSVMLAQLPGQYQQLPDNVLFEGIVDQLIDQYLLSEEAESNGGPSKAQQLRLENERRALLASALIEEVMTGDVAEEDVQAAYDETYGDQPAETEYNASHILVETEDEAKAVVEELGGGADFAELAKEKSTVPSGPNGGELGWFGKGQMVPEFENAVTALEVGAVSEPVQTQFGWHVITLNETRDKPAPTLEETRAQLVDRIRQETMQARVDGLRSDAEIEMLTDGIDPGAFRNPDLLAD